MRIFWHTFLFLLPLVYALPLEHRANMACGKFETIASDPYSLMTNLWGSSTATPGSQCSTLLSVNDEIVKWFTRWVWSGNNHIKSYSNIQLNEGINQPLSAITSMPSVWKWSQRSSGNVVSNVAYDFFISPFLGGEADGSSLKETMIWLADFDAQPISHEYDSHGQAIPITTIASIAGRNWKLYFGNNGYNDVYSFLPIGGHIASFNGDLYPFFACLINYGYISASDYLIVAQAGTEATLGGATFETSAYQLTIN